MISIPVFVASLGIAYALYSLIIGDSMHALTSCIAVFIYLHVRSWLGFDRKKDRKG